MRTTPPPVLTSVHDPAAQHQDTVVLTDELQAPLPALLPRDKGTAVLRRCLLLALLLHVWLVVLIGNVPPGTAQPGSGVGGAINVRLGGDVNGPALDTPSRSAPRASGGEGAAVAARQGGSVRDTAPAADLPPGAARLGDWSPAVPEAAARDLLPAARAPTPAAAPEQPAGAPAPQGVVTQTSAAPALSAAAAPLPSAALVPVPAMPVPDATQATLAAPALAPMIPTFNPTLPGVQGQASANRPALPLTGPAATLAMPQPQALPAALAPNRAVAADPRLAAPAAVSAPLQTATPLPAMAPVASPAALPNLPSASTAPMPTPTAMPSPEAAPSVPGTPAVAPSPAPQAGPSVVPSVTPPATPSVTPSAGPVPDIRPAITAPVPGGIGRGAPDAGEQPGRDVATPATAAASAPRLNLELPRSRGGELSSRGSRGVLPLLARPPEVKSKLATDIERAGKADCTKAYAGAGLLAVVPLAVDALKKDSGCKW